MRRLVLTISALGLCLTSAAAQQGGFDAAPFGQPLAAKNSIGVEWAEMRRVARVELVFANDGVPLPSPAALEVQYWRQSWKGAAYRPYAGLVTAWAGWEPIDDGTNGEWKTADSRVQVEGHKVIFTFASSERKEFSELKAPGVTYRPTLKVRVIFASTHPRVQALRAITDSGWKAPLEITMRFENRRACDDRAEAWNGAIESAGHSALRDGVCLKTARVHWVTNPDDPEADRTIVTVRSPSHPFSFAVDEVARGDRIDIKDFGVLVTRADDPITIAENRRLLADSGEKSVYDRVGDHAEQSLSGAWGDMPLKHPYFFVLGLEGARQRFRLNAEGDLWVNRPTFAEKRPGRDTGRFLWPDWMTYHYGLPAAHFADRHLAEGYLPIVTTTWYDDGLIYQEDAFADVLAGGLEASRALEADEPVVAMMEFRLVNDSNEARTAHLTFSTEPSNPKDPHETLRAEGSLIFGRYQGRAVLREMVETRGAGRLSDSPEGVRYEIDLAAHAEHSITVKVPFITLTSEAEIATLRSLDLESERAKAARFWRDRVAAGAEIETPEPWLNDFYKAHVTHLLINDEREVGSDRYAARVGSSTYGVYGNESTMMIADFDRRGYAKEAERSLELFLHYQGTVPLPGNFTTKQGVLYGAGGYEADGYNQHHGWILWGLAEHYWFTRDRVWMAHAAPHIVEACRWIESQRRTTQKLDALGRRSLEYGLLPAGALEDVKDYWYWISTNCFTWWGLEDAARALDDYGAPEAGEFEREAADYREAILRAYREAAVRSPVARLRDGTYVPDYPSSVTTRGRDYGWIRETLEGALMLPITRLLEPKSQEAEWILKDYEDNRYISDRFGYSIPVFEQYWFSRGGFSMQPNLLGGPLAYLYRDDIPRFLRAYFNPFAAAFDPTLRELCEHPLPELGYFIGDLFKSSDEAQSNGWLRMMFVMEDGALYLGRGLPREWLKDGRTIGIRNAPTYYGPVTYQIRSNSAGAGTITMALDPPVRNAPHQIIVRFRHPDAKPIRQVTVNGNPWSDFDAARGDIRLPGDLKSHTNIAASY